MNEMNQPKNVNSLTELEDFSGIVLTEQEQGGTWVGAGVMPFGDLAAPVVAPNAKEAKFGAMVKIPKGTEQAKHLFATIQHVANKKWSTEPQKLALIAFQIANGLKGMGSNISIYDGDLNAPEYNGGHWVVSAKCKQNEPPMCSFRTDQGLTQMCQSPEHFPTNGDGVQVIVNLWAMPTQDRVNLKLLGCIRELEGVAAGGPSKAEVAATVQAAMQLPPPQIEGVQVASPTTTALPQGQPVQAQPVQAQPVQAQPVQAPVGPPVQSMFDQPVTDAAPTQGVAAAQGGPVITTLD